MSAFLAVDNVGFSSVLPWLAELPPPGVDMELVLRMENETLSAAQQGCTKSCNGMSCPTGWMTKLDMEKCKCICKRTDDSKVTPWDLERKAAAAASETN